MRKSLSLPVILFCSWLLFFSTISAKASSPSLPAEAVWHRVKLSEFVKLSPAGFNRLTGQRMNLQQRVSFGMLKQMMKKSLRRSGDQTVGEFLAIKRRHYKWWQIVILIGLTVLMVIVVVNISKIY